MKHAPVRGTRVPLPRSLRDGTCKTGPGVLRQWTYALVQQVPALSYASVSSSVPII